MNKLVKEQMKKLLDLKISYCRTCGNKRIEVTSEQSPDKVKFMKDVMGADSKILYCKECHEYGVVGDFESTL